MADTHSDICCTGLGYFDFLDIKRVGNRLHLKVVLLRDRLELFRSLLADITLYCCFDSTFLCQRRKYCIHGPRNIANWTDLQQEDPLQIQLLLLSRNISSNFHKPVTPESNEHSRGTVLVDFHAVRKDGNLYPDILCLIEIQNRVSVPSALKLNPSNPIGEVWEACPGSGYLSGNGNNCYQIDFRCIYLVISPIGGLAHKS